MGCPFFTITSQQGHYRAETTKGVSTGVDTPLKFVVHQAGFEPATP